MRTLLLVVVLVAGCKDKRPTEPAKPGSASAAPAADAALAWDQNTLKLPKYAGTPPVKTTKPIDKAKAEPLSQTEFEGFDRDVRIADDRGIDVRYTTKARPRIMVTVNAMKCFDCVAMEADKWKPKADSLKLIAGPDLKDRPDTTYEHGMTDITGTPYAWTYHVGYNITPSDTEGVTGAYGTAYAIYYNDGVNMIRVVAEYKDDIPKSREAMVNLTPKEDLEAIAKAFADRFVHLW